jgi:hypothetical protein
VKKAKTRLLRLHEIYFRRKVTDKASLAPRPMTLVNGICGTANDSSRLVIVNRSIPNFLNSANPIAGGSVVDQDSRAGSGSSIPSESGSDPDPVF